MLFKFQMQFIFFLSVSHRFLFLTISLYWRRYYNNFWLAQNLLFPHIHGAFRFRSLADSWEVYNICCTALCAWLFLHPARRECPKAAGSLCKRWKWGGAPGPPSTYSVVLPIVCLSRSFLFPMTLQAFFSIMSVPNARIPYWIFFYSFHTSPYYTSWDCSSWMVLDSPSSCCPL